MPRYAVIRHSDDTGCESVAREFRRLDKAEHFAADCNRTARYYAGAVTYRVARPVAELTRAAVLRALRYDR